MKIKVTSDSTCDLSKELVEKYNIGILPLIVVKDGVEHRDGVDIVPADIFAHVAAGGDLCSTAALGVGDYEEYFKQFADDYDGVLHINIGSCFSSCHQNACIASQEFSNVKAVDSKNLSTGQGLVVLKACELAESCESLEELYDQINDFTGRVEASFLLDQLKYMAKGGRCSAATALGANLLNLKPCIEVRDGKMGVVKKYRGNYAKCLANYVKDRLTNRDDLDDWTLFVTHTPVTEECEKAVAAAVAESTPFKNTYWTEAGCTVSCHCGPATLGVLFVRK
jgi:DegV family protein with EDD domain